MVSLGILICRLLSSMGSLVSHSADGADASFGLMKALAPPPVSGADQSSFHSLKTRTIRRLNPHEWTVLVQCIVSDRSVHLVLGGGHRDVPQIIISSLCLDTCTLHFKLIVLTYSSLKL